MIIYGFFRISLRELVAHALKFYEKKKIAAKDLVECKLCKRWTKYCCIQRETSHLQLLLGAWAWSWWEPWWVGRWKASWLPFCILQKVEFEAELYLADRKWWRSRKGGCDRRSPEGSWIMTRKCGIGSRPFSFSLYGIKICPDVHCALRIRCCPKVRLDSVRFDTSVERRLNRT